MLKLVCGLFLSFLSVHLAAQIRLDKLVLEPGKSFLLEGSDIIVVDTLVMGDSSHIILNRSKTDNFIHAKIARIGKGCTIDGSGKRGDDGATGAAGADQPTPCRQAYSGADGEYGHNGENGNNLFIYSDDIQINGSLIINLNGGNGGRGGDGGNGGGGGPGTRVCPGGDGGQGGSGMRGGHGGDGGNLSIQCKRCPDLQIWTGSKLYIKNYGGIGGEGGNAGRGGLAGLGPLRDGRNGTRGVRGEEGQPGKSGSVNFNRN
ncbi:MAG: hypothetical protein KIT62_15580 [Cyclobacteriaceae bacterium]|nr:hypothetical protein [Cyclobacteriaceae bacterium]